MNYFFLEDKTLWYLKLQTWKYVKLPLIMQEGATP